MHPMGKGIFSLIFLWVWPGVLTALESMNLAVIEQIKTEAFQHSKVMEHVFYLADVYGPPCGKKCCHGNRLRRNEHGRSPL